jgi:predicted LPLAT superfamily acyltransferase
VSLVIVVIYVTLGIVLLFTVWAWGARSAAQLAKEEEAIKVEDERFAGRIAPMDRKLSNIEAEERAQTTAIDKAQVKAAEYAEAAQERDTALQGAVAESEEHIIEAVDIGTDRVLEALASQRAEFV